MQRSFRSNLIDAILARAKDDPKIVVICYIQNGYSGAYSSPACIKTIEYYLDSLKHKESTSVTQEFTMAE